MSTESTVIAGIVIPSQAPAFLAMVGLHVAFALVAVGAGLAAMMSRKKPGRHPRFGTLYYRSLCLVFVSSSILAVVRWPEDVHLFALGLAAMVAATLGRLGRRRTWRHWPRWHISGMGGSYILLLIAFYVDNGRNLPLWRDLPPMTYWLIPAAVGIPIMLRALRRHDADDRTTASSP